MNNLDSYIKRRYDDYKDIFNVSKIEIIFIEPRYRNLNYTEIFSILKQKYSNLFNIELIEKDTELPSFKNRFKFTKLKEN